MYGAGYYGALVFGAGLVVTTPVPPAGASNGYGTAVYGAHVYGAGAVVTSQVPVPPTPTTTQGNGYGTSYYGAHVYGAGVVVTSQVPVPPTPPEPKPIGVYGAPYDPPRPVNPHARVSSLAEIASNPWRQSALLERAYREDEELLQIVEELVRHLQ